MKIFWLIIALFSATTVVLFATDGSSKTPAEIAPTAAASDHSSSQNNPTDSQPAPEVSEPSVTMTTGIEPTDTELIPDSTPVELAADATLEPLTEQPAPAETIEVAEAPSADPPAARIESEETVEIAAAPREVSIEDLLGLLQTSPPAETTAFDDGFQKETAAVVPDAAQGTGAEAQAAADEAPPVILAGEGTQDSPYVVSWDVLSSARNTFDPKQGKSEIPEVVESLDGKWVSLSGYTLFPLANPQPREVLLMLNPWDGCCIGVPPSPYDAIEVSLASSVGEERFAQEGRVVGKLNVDPYMVGDWLIGLYTINGATFEVTGG